MVDIMVIHYHKEVVGEERKITQMVSGHSMVGIGDADQVGPP